MEDLVPNERYPEGLVFTPESYPSYHSLSRLKDQAIHYDKRWRTWGQSDVTFNQLNNKPFKEYR